MTICINLLKKFGYFKKKSYICNMEKIKCFNCGNDITVNIANAIDEEGEEFICPHCKQTFRYTHK